MSAIATAASVLPLRPLLWPAVRLADALELLARHAGLIAPGSENLPPLPAPPPRGPARDAWLDAAASHLGLETEPVQVPFGDVPALVQGGGPALLRVSDGEQEYFLALLGGRRGKAELLAPDMKRHRVDVDEVDGALCHELVAPLAETMEDILDLAEVAPTRRKRATRALLRDRLARTPLRGSWLLRPCPGTSFWRQMSRARLPRHLWAFLGAHLVTYLLMLGAWALVGRGALQGHLDRGWLLAWALLLLTQVPFQLITGWNQGKLAIGLGTLLKQRLMHGALRLEPDEVRHLGAGQILGRVIESSAVESLALGAGLAGLMAVVELGLALSVLYLGAGGAVHALLLLGWVLLTGLIALTLYRATLRWTESRLEMTHDLVERMVGHRTRLAQEARERWHDGEDEALERYLQASQRLDRLGVVLGAVVSRGWMVLGLLGLAPAFVLGGASGAGLAVGVGGVLLAGGALAKVVGSITSLGGAFIAWQQVAPLFRAAARPTLAGAATAQAVLHEADRSEDPNTPVLEANHLTFRYRPASRAVLRGCDLRIFPGDRLLLQGPSGGGKSTLAALVSGLRPPESGLLLLRGLDVNSLGSAGWRSRVAAAPQFHENHVLTGTFAFNLLMGRAWPPDPRDLEQAEQVCHELGLGPLLERMPAGLNQVVGDTGWRLSHGEQSRLFIARALLQRADLVVLDESFAALDPDNLHQALQCVLRRAPALLVIAHP